MAIPTLNGRGFQSTTTSSVSPAYANLSGTAPAAGEAIFLFVVYMRTDSWSWPSGFSDVVPQFDVAGTMRVGLAWKRATGSEGASETISGLTGNTGSDGIHALLLNYGNVHATDPPYEGPPGTNSGSGLTWTPVDLSVYSDNRQALQFVGVARAGFAIGRSVGSPTGETVSPSGASSGYPSGSGGVTTLDANPPVGEGAAKKVEAASFTATGLNPSTITGGSGTIGGTGTPAWGVIGLALIGVNEARFTPSGTFYATLV